MYKIYHSSVTDPRINLAFEEYFLSEVQNDEIIIFFWQSENAVVIGRNQNPYQECNLLKLHEDETVLVRRLSGGGAVYHDLGNLNFSFIAPNHLYDTERQFDIVIRTLNHLGIRAGKSGRNDLTVEGRKFSGNAFITEEHASLHHGTLLIDADIGKVMKYLTVSHKKLDTKGFDSIASRIINLSELNKALNSQIIIETIQHILAESYDVSFEEMPAASNLEEYTQKYMSHEWNYGDCPKFDVEIEEKFDWGLISMNLVISDGKVCEFRLFTDCLETSMFEKFNREIYEYELTSDNMNKLIIDCFNDIVIAQDIQQLVERELFS